MKPSHKPYTVLAIMNAKPGKEQALREMLSSLVEPTRQEEGCINYYLHESVDTPGEFMFYENWVSQEAHEFHRQTPHFKIWHAAKAELLNGTSDVSKWNIVE